jgi:endo-1,4-beta-D-glucanase Y
MKIYLTITVLLLGFIDSLAQMNTPSNATKPFGSNESYQYGILPTNLTANDIDIQSEYASWKTNYVEACGTTMARVKFDETANTVSEGIAYGMLLAAYAADKDLFDRLWAYYKNFRNRNGVMHWKISGCNTINQQNGATDAELDAAMALIVANYQWPTNASPHNYKTDGVALINAIKTHETASDGTFYNGDMWKPDCRNPSYQAPAYARAFKRFMADNGSNQDSFWDNVATKTEALFAANAHSTSGLNTNWCTPAGPPSSSCSGSGTAPDKFGYDACRAPWRQAVDILWYGPTTASTVQPVVNRAIDFWITKGASNVQGGNNMNHDGSGSGDRNCAFWGPVGAQSLAVSNTTAHQTFCNQMYTQNKLNSGATGYFTKILQMIGLFVQSGNFWNPYATGGSTIPVTNTNPTISLTAPITNSSVCAGASVTITADAKDSDGTISKVEFYNGSTLLGTSTSSPFTFIWQTTSAGSATLNAKAFDNLTGTATSSSVLVTINTAPVAPSVSSPVSFCLNTTATALTASGSNLKWYTSATGGTSLNSTPVPSTATAGSQLYYVSQSLNNCESARATVTVNIVSTTSPLVVSPVNYCQNATTSSLSANGTALKWYTSSTGGNASNTAILPSSSNIGSTSYYVSQTANGCESPRTEIVVNVGAKASTPVVTTPVTYCQGATASALTATGTNLLWYTSQTGGNASSVGLVPNTSVANSTTYYVSQTGAGCESDRKALSVIVNSKPALPTVTTNSFTYNVGDKATTLSASGNGLKWYTTATGGTASNTAPTPSTTNTGTTVYYVSQTSASGCESERASITVTVGNIYKIYKTATNTTPVIDGAVDEVWNNALIVSGNTLNNLVGTNGGNNLSGSFKALWDNNFLYILSTVTDNVKTNDSPEVYNDDAVEIYLDINNDKSTTYGSDDFQYSFGYNDGTIVTANPSSRATSNIEYQMVATNNGYIFEAKIPWATLAASPIAGKQIGFDFMLNDDDNGGERDGKIAWNASTDDAWQNTSIFGTAMLSDIVISSYDDVVFESMSVHPNPTNGNVFINGLEGKYEFEIIDMTGVSVAKGNNESNINITNYPSGIYGVIIKKDGSQKMTKIVKVD